MMWTRIAAAMLIASAAGIANAATAAPSYRQVATIAGPDGGWDLTSVDPVGHRLYLARSDGLLAVDTVSGRMTPTVIAAQRGHAALAIPGGHEVLVTNGGADTATIVDGVTGKVRATIPTGNRPDAAAYDSRTRSLWVMNPGSENITVIDAASAKVVGTLPVGGSLELAVTDGSGHLFVNIEDKNQVAVIDTIRHTVVRRFPLAGCDGPTGIAYSARRRLLISACANGRAIVSATDGRQVASLPIGPGADGALFDERRQVALVPSGGDGTLSVISLAGKPRVIDRIATAKSARTAALDPATGRIYLAAADLRLPVGKDRPKAVPGTFRIIVLEPTARLY